VKAVFTDTLIFSNAEHVPELNKNIIGGIQATKIPEFRFRYNTKKQNFYV
jgi:hypothetical protein